MKDIDTRVHHSISDGPKNSREIKEDLGLESGDDDLLDRTLQKLRRAGKIRVVRRRWATEDVKVCSTCKGHGWVRD